MNLTLPVMQSIRDYDLGSVPPLLGDFWIIGWNRSSKSCWSAVDCRLSALGSTRYDEERLEGRGEEEVACLTGILRDWYFG